MRLTKEDLLTALDENKMQKWRAKFARDMLLFAILFIGMGGLVVASLWLWRDKIITKFLASPVKGVIVLASITYALFVLARMIPLLLSARRDTHKHMQWVDSVMAKRERGEP